MSDLIPLSVPEIRGNEWHYIKECLDTGWVSSVGSFVDRFEKEIKNYTGAKHAVACMNGTSALHVSMVIAGVQPDDEVIMPTLTFIAPVNVVKYINAHPVFMDCDEYYNLDYQKTIEFIETGTIFRDGCSYNRLTGRRISALIPVHVFGNAARLDDLAIICGERNIAIIEDATESLGSRYTEGIHAGRHTGTVGQLGCYSFNGNKIITTGGGGMIVTDSEEYAKKAKYLTTQAKDDEVYFIHNEIGYNYRMTNIQAAMGVAQLEMLPEYIHTKKEHYAKYIEYLSGTEGIALCPVPPYSDNNHWMYALQLNPRHSGGKRDRLIKGLKEKNIQTRPVWHLNHLQKPYKNCQTYRIEHAYLMIDKTINIPCSVGLSDEDIRRVADAIRSIE